MWLTLGRQCLGEDFDLESVAFSANESSASQTPTALIGWALGGRCAVRSPQILKNSKNGNEEPWKALTPGFFLNLVTRASNVSNKGGPMWGKFQLVKSQESV